MQQLIKRTESQADLKIDEIDFLRLLARKYVTAAQAGENGDWWVDPDSQKKYILAGCPDLRRPVDITATGFDHGALRATGDVWAGKVRNEVEALIPATPPADGVNEIRISPTSGGLSALMAATTPTTSFTPDEVKRIGRWSDAYLIPALRNHIGIILRESKGEPHGMARLYDPRHYNEITTEAMSRLKRGSISIRKYYPAAEAWREPRRVSFELSHADIVGTRGQELITLAF